MNIVVGTPGRVAHFIEEKTLNLASVKALVLDEADQMLDIGWIFNGVLLVCYVLSVNDFWKDLKKTSRKL